MKSSQKQQKSILSSYKITKQYKKLNHNQKFLLWIFIGTFILSFSLTMLISTVRTYDSDLSTQQCNQLRIDDVRYFLELQEDNNILAFIYAFQYPFKFMLIAIGISWILHGVGFHIIKR